MQADQQTIIGLIEALGRRYDRDDPAQTLVSDALLAYRFLRYTNSAALGLRTEIESVRRGLMVLGHARLKDWLLQQLPHAVSDVDLQPIRTAMAVRRGNGTATGRGRGRRIAPRALPVRRAVSDRPGLGRADGHRFAAHSGARADQASIATPRRAVRPYLEIAIALESSNTQAILSLCESHDLSAGETNRVLLRTLGSAPARSTRGLLLV
ncbi:MAG: HDOD domain-containing protein [Rhodoferax sp.]|nr:HDOD domain-containing protein [Rhodoferax sp.]